MKINYISPFSPYEFNGGGEMVLREILEYGKSKNHDIRLNTLYPDKKDLHNAPDLTILADLFNAPAEKASFPIEYLLNITENSKYIHFDNAYVDLCDKPYLPCNGQSRKFCPHVVSKHLSYNRIQAKKFINNRKMGLLCPSRNSSLRGKIYLNSTLNVFVSPLHEKIIYGLLRQNNLIKNACCGEDINGKESGFLKKIASKGYVLKPLIDTDLFYLTKSGKKGMASSKRKYSYLFVGAISEAKGLLNYKKLSFRNEIVFAGPLAYGKKMKFGNYLGYVPYEKIPELMQNSKNFIYLPRWPEPQGRVVVEASLSGCEIIGNDNIGALSFPFELGLPENYKNVLTDFWEKIETI